MRKTKVTKKQEQIAARFYGTKPEEWRRHKARQADPSLVHQAVQGTVQGPEGGQGDEVMTLKRYDVLYDQANDCSYLGMKHEGRAYLASDADALLAALLTEADAEIARLTAQVEHLEAAVRYAVEHGLMCNKTASERLRAALSATPSAKDGGA